VCVVCYVNLSLYFRLSVVVGRMYFYFYFVLLLELDKGIL